jgi:hypoxanthine phosphoribosyltransferase
MTSDKLEHILVSGQEIQARVSALAAQINADYVGREIDVICLLNGGSVFCADLARRLTVPTRIHQFGFTSYPQGNVTGEVRITLDVTEPLHDRHVLVVEGIVISGRTPRYLLDLFALRRPASLAMCALGRKPAQLQVDLPLVYTAFEFGPEFIVGYGIGSGAAKMSPSLLVSQS